MRWKKKVMELETTVKKLESIAAGRDSLLQESRNSVHMYSSAWLIMKQIREASAHNMNFIPYKQWLLKFRLSSNDNENFSHGYTHGQEEILSMLVCDIRQLCKELGYDYEDANGFLLKTEDTGCNKNLLYFQDALSCSPFNRKLLPGDTLIISSYRPDGRYSTEYIKYESMDQIAAVICANEYDKLFCSGDDYAVFCTEGKHLNSCVEGLDEEFVAELMKAVEKAGQK